MLPKHKYLITYRLAEIIHDLTVEFCKRNLGYRSDLGGLGEIPKSRTIDQTCPPSLRSGAGRRVVQKLLGVAAASFEELVTDYEDFLRQRNMAIWPKTHPKVQAFRKRATFLTSIGNLGDLGDLKVKPHLSEDPETAANLLFTLCHMETYLLSNQITKAESDFVTKGGFTESLFKKRLQSRIG